jgi:predicted nucleic-acid-binding protein
MRAVDADLLVRLIVRDDLAQVRLAEEFLSKGAWASHLVVAEVVWVLDAVYDLTAEQIGGAITMLLDHSSLTLQDADVVRAALDQFRKRLAVSFSDCLVLEISRMAGHLPIGTFDRDFARLDGVERLKP